MAEVYWIPGSPPLRFGAPGMTSVDPGAGHRGARIRGIMPAMTFSVRQMGEADRGAWAQMRAALFKLRAVLAEN